MHSLFNSTFNNSFYCNCIELRLLLIVAVYLLLMVYSLYSAVEYFDCIQRENFRIALQLLNVGESLEIVHDRKISRCCIHHFCYSQTIRCFLFEIDHFVACIFPLWENANCLTNTQSIFNGRAENKRIKLILRCSISLYWGTEFLANGFWMSVVVTTKSSCYTWIPFFFFTNNCNSKSNKITKKLKQQTVDEKKLF